ncbi:hypothetical protein [Halalkalibacterium ligniniphilum]|uniref:hypothetical protein n=1 Tax=Halalkalibacterium ligniniphilum TaxID=1134413 RepID=UPI000366B056|nr:hypothetical protein [Halalkalibacterium ligniniphilum]
MSSDIIVVLTAFGFFLLIGVFGAIGIYSVLHGKKQRAKWSFAIGFACIAVYLVSMFTRI